MNRDFVDYPLSDPVICPACGASHNGALGVTGDAGPDEVVDPYPTFLCHEYARTGPRQYTYTRTVGMPSMTGKAS